MLLHRQFLCQRSRAVVPFEGRIRHDDLGHSAHGSLPPSTRPIFQRLSLAIAGLSTSDLSYADAQVSGDLRQDHLTLDHSNRAVAGRQRLLLHHWRYVVWTRWVPREEWPPPSSTGHQGSCEVM